MRATTHTSLMQRRTISILAFSLGAAAPALAVPNAEVAARVYPVKPIRFIVAAPPAGPADVVARLVGPRMADAWQQPVVIDNRAGANGIMGIELIARAAPDGYTVAMVGTGLAINPSLYARVPYDPVRDFSPVTHAISVPNVLVLHPSVPFSGLQELVGVARTRPTAVLFAPGARGTTGHLALELFQVVAGTRFAQAPAKGIVQALSDVVNGQAQALFSGALHAMPHVRAGRLRAMAVTSATRTRAAPEVPTVAESGYAGYEVTGWFGVVAPARTPASVVAKVNAEMVRILRLPEIEQRLVAQAADPVASDPAAFSRHIEAEALKWARIVKQAGIKPD